MIPTKLMDIQDPLRRLELENQELKRIIKLFQAGVAALPKPEEEDPWLSRPSKDEIMLVVGNEHFEMPADLQTKFRDALLSWLNQDIEISSVFEGYEKEDHDPEKSLPETLIAAADEAETDAKDDCGDDDEPKAGWKDIIGDDYEVDTDNVLKAMNSLINTLEKDSK